MHESMMIAEVGGIVNVSGSRIATPFAPPRPGSTPMITPRITPTNISIKLNGVSATLNPFSSDVISAKASLPVDALVELEPRLERALRQRQLEPDFEQQEEHDADADRDHHRREPRVAPEPSHEERDEQRRGHVQAGRLDQRDVDDRRHEHPQHLPERAAR